MELIPLGITNRTRLGILHNSGNAGINVARSRFLTRWTDFPNPAHRHREDRRISAPVPSQSQWTKPPPATSRYSYSIAARQKPHLRVTSPARKQFENHGSPLEAPAAVQTDVAPRLGANHPPPHRRYALHTLRGFPRLTSRREKHS